MKNAILFYRNMEGRKPLDIFDSTFVEEEQFSRDTSNALSVLNINSLLGYTKLEPEDRVEPGIRME